MYRSRIVGFRRDGRPIHPIAGAAEITLESLGSMTAEQLRDAQQQLVRQIQDIHFDQDGSIRSDLSAAESRELQRLMVLTERCKAHELIRRQMGRPGATQRAFGESTGAVPAAERGDLLSRDQSVAGWLQRKGHVERDRPELSFDRWLRGHMVGDWQHADAELAAEQELRALSEGTLTAGGHLVPTPLAAQVIDLARNQMRVVQAGATTVPMSSNTLKVPRLTGEGTPAWHAENATITAADLTFDAVTFDAQTLTRLIVLSIELFEDADPSAEGVIAKSFAAQVALEFDRAALRGSGTAPEPRGVPNTSGITTTAHGANGSVIGSPPAAGTMGWEFLVDSVGAVRGSNFEPTAQIAAPRTEQSLAKLRDTTNQYIAPPRYLDNIPRLLTKQIPTNLTVGTSTDCSEVYTGQWDLLMLGIRTTFRIMPLRERFIDNGQYGFLAWMRADVQLAQPAAFVVDAGVRS